MSFPTDRIYKFTSFNEYSIAALADHSAWFSKIKNLNDPFEGFAVYSEANDENERITRCVNFAARSLENKLSHQQALDLVIQRYIEDKEKFIARIESEINNIKLHRQSFLDSICIYSTSVDIPSYPYPNYANMLMWSHYGDGFTGFCLQFSANEFFMSLKNGNSNITWGALNYVSTAPFIDVLNKDHNEYCKPILTKHEQWSYEGELRFISQKEGLHPYSPESLKSIYIGDKMPSEQRKTIMAIAKNCFPNVNVYIVKIHTNGYQVVAKKI